MTFHRSNLGPSCPPEEATDQSHHGKGCTRNHTCEEEKRRAERFRYRRRQRQLFSATSARRAAIIIITLTIRWRRTESCGRNRRLYQRLHRGTRMPDDDRRQDGHGVGGMQRRSRNMRICRNPICYRCDIIDKAELE
eukprot:4903367-Heterocapsa_arctica.AAC.1